MVIYFRVLGVQAGLLYCILCKGPFDIAADFKGELGLNDLQILHPK